MSTHSSTLTWKIPWTEEPSRLQSMESQRVSTFTFTFHLHELEKEMATHSSILAQRIPGTEEPVGCCLWGRTELDTTEMTQQQQQQLLSSIPAFSPEHSVLFVCLSQYFETFFNPFHLVSFLTSPGSPQPARAFERATFLSAPVF